MNANYLHMRSKFSALTRARMATTKTNCDNFVWQKQSHTQRNRDAFARVCFISFLFCMFVCVCFAFTPDCVTIIIIFPSHASAFYSLVVFFVATFVLFLYVISVRCDAVANWNETLTKMKSSPQLYRRNAIIYTLEPNVKF